MKFYAPSCLLGLLSIILPRGNKSCVCLPGSEGEIIRKFGLNRDVKGWIRTEKEGSLSLFHSFRSQAPVIATKQT